MSTWVEGKEYDYYGRPLLCVRRFFVGPLEHVELAAVGGGRVVVDGEVERSLFVRTARALASCVLPRVTETLGGVTAPATCRHEWYGRVVANAGPHVGLSCCVACGTPTGESN